MQKLLNVRFANSVLCGGTQKNFFEAPEYDLILDEFVILVKKKSTGKSVVSTLFNTIYYTPDEQAKVKRIRGASRASEQDFKDPELFEAQGV